MNSLAYVCTLEFIFSKSSQASRISMIGLPVIVLRKPPDSLGVQCSFSDEK